MTIGNPPASGPNAVAEYQVSSVPYLSSSTIPASTVVGFFLPFVTRTVQVRNLGGAGELRVGVSYSGTLAKNYFSVPVSSSQDLDMRTTTLFLYNSAGAGTLSYSLNAGLTTIPVKNFPMLTASNGFDGVG